MAKLTFALEDDREIVVPLDDRITLGRSEDNDVVVDDERVSKHHAELLRNADGSIQVFDLGSTAGTYVNDERVHSHTVRHGDCISFGPLKACLDLEEPPFDPAPAINNGHHPANGKNGGKISRRKRDPNSPSRSNANKATALPAAELRAQQQAAEQQLAQLHEELRQVQEQTSSAKKEFQEWQIRAEEERAAHSKNVASLRAEEQRLRPALAAVQEAEAKHQKWLEAIEPLITQHAEQKANLQTLTAECEKQTTELNRLVADETAARSELETLASHRRQAIAHLEQIRADCTHDESILSDLRHQLVTAESRAHEAGELAAAREDQIRAAEKKLEQLTHNRESLEERIHTLSNVEERLTRVLEQCHEANARHEKLGTATANLETQRQQLESTVTELKASLAALEAAHAKTKADTATADSTRQQAEALLKKEQEALAGCEKALAERRREIAAESQRLDEIKAQRSIIAQQCAELADAEQRLAATREQLDAAKKLLSTAATDIENHAEQISTQQDTLKKLGQDEAEAHTRIKALADRETTLRATLSTLSSAEHTERERFEEIRKLISDAAAQHAAQKEDLAAEMQSARSALEDLLNRLTPLREWKEAMDGLYAKLATLPQESAEARALWHEIEKEKAGLLKLITDARAQAHPCSTTTAPIPTSDHGTARSTPMHVAAPSTSTQEAILRARLNHLRENVRHEEERLEHLRLERIHHAPPASTSSAATAMLREQARHLEIKIRQEEERHHSLLHNIEVARLEEEKRRTRLTEMEHKLAELRADISEAEHLRGELRQQADLIQSEIRNHEAALERAKRNSQG